MTLQELLVDLKLNATSFVSGISASAQEWQQFSGALAKGGAMLSAAVTAPILAVGKAAMTMAGQLQSAEIGFTTMLGSAQQAGAFLEELKDFAAKTPFEFKDLVLGAKRMMALGFEAKQVVPVLRSLGDASAGLGGGAELINRLTLALGQMRAKGKVSAEEMRQLAEAGVPAWKILADAIGATEQQVVKLAEKGAIPAQAAMEALITGIGSKFSGLMDQFSRTAMGQFSNLKDSLGYIMADIGKNLLPIASTLLEQFAIPAANALKNVAARFSELDASVRNTAIGMAALVASIGPVTLALAGVAKIAAPTITAVSAAASGVSAAMTMLQSSIGNIVFAVQNNLVGALTSGEAALLGIGRAVMSISPQLLAVAAIFAAGFAIDKALSQIESLDASLADAEDALERARSSGGTLQEKLTELRTAFKESGEGAGAFGGNLKLAETAVKTFQEEVGKLARMLTPELTKAVREGADSLANLGGSSRDYLESLQRVGEAQKKLAGQSQEFYRSLDSEEVKMAPGLNQQLATSMELAGMAATDAGQRISVDMGKALTEYVGKAGPVFRTSEEITRSVTTQGVKLGELVAQYGKVSAAVKAVADPFAAVKKQLEGDQEKELKKHVDELEAAYNQLFRRFNAGEDVFDQLTTASVRLQQAQDKLNPERVAERATKAWEEAERRYDKFEKDNLDLIKSISELNKKLAEANEELAQAAIKTAGEFEKAYQQIQATAQQQIAIDPVTALRAEWEKTKTALAEAWQAYSVGRASVEEVARAQDAAARAAEAYNNAVASQVARLGQLNPALAETYKQMQKVNEAFRTAGITSTVSLVQRAEELQKAYELIAASVGKFGVTERDALEAEKKALEARIEAHRAAGEKITDAEKKRLEELNKQLEKYAGKQKSTWSGMAQQVSTIISDFARDIAKGFTDLISGGSRREYNQNLNDQLSDLQKSLAERTAEWEAYQQEVTKTAEELRQKHATELAQEEADLDASLAERVKAYEDAEAETVAALAELREEYAKELAEKLADLEESLQEERAEYEAYVRDVEKELVEIRQTHAEQLAKELADLDEALEDKRRSYEEYVADVNRKLSSIHEDYQDNIADETRSVKRRIKDKQKEYARDEQDILRQIARLQKAGKKENDAEIQDLRISLQRKKEDLEEYVYEANEDLEEYKKEQKERLDEEEADLRLSLERRTAEWQRYQAENATDRATAIAENAADLAKEEATLQASLEKRRAQWEAYQADIDAKKTAAIASSTEELAEEEAQLQTSLAKKKAALDAYRDEVAVKLEELRTKHAEELAGEEADLAESLAKKQLEYDKYVAEVNQKAEEIREKFRTVAGDLVGFFEDAFKSMGEAVTRYLLEGAIKDLLKIVAIDGILHTAFKTLVEAIKGLFSKIAGTITDIFTGGSNAAGGVSNVAGAAGGIGGAAAGIAGAGASSVAGIITGAASAISGVIGNFQMAGMNKTLDLIEHEARYAQIHLYYILEKLNEYLPKVQDVWNYLWQVQKDVLSQINDSIRTMHAMIGPNFLDVLYHMNEMEGIMLAQSATALPASLAPATAGAVSVGGVTVEGNVIGNREFLTEMDRMIAGRLRLQGVLT